MTTKRWRLSLTLYVLSVGTMAHAGPPFLTDDPEPVELRHTEINLALQATRAASGWSGTMGADVNYGCAKETQCHFAVPGAYSHAPGAALQTGLGDIELGVKYRFLNDEDSGFMAAVYPTLYLPTGNASRGLGNGHAQLLLPVWVQKTSGPLDVGRRRWPPVRSGCRGPQQLVLRAVGKPVLRGRVAHRHRTGPPHARR